MGTGFSCTCGKCSHTYSVYLGTGMLFEDIYRNEINRIASGEYGLEIKNVYANTPCVAINVESVVYICSSCKHWMEGTDHTLYAPNHLTKKHFRMKAVDNWSLKNDYHVIRRYYQKCAHCGKRMHKASEKELSLLPCPNCGDVNEGNHNDFLWD